MAKMTTHQMMDGYFEENPKHEKKTRSQVDRPEVYAYEEKVGKQIVEMNEEELLDMISTFRSHKYDSANYTIYSSYLHISSLYRQIFEWYSTNVELIANVWNRKTMKGSAAINRLMEKSTVVVTMDTVNDIIRRLYDDYCDERASYVECIMRLFLAGIRAAEEIVQIREEDIDFKRNRIILARDHHEIAVDTHCINLLMKVHSMTEIPTTKNLVHMKPWNDHYFKYPVRGTSDVDKYDSIYMGRMINKQIKMYVSDAYKIDLSGLQLFYLGFYNYLVEQYGEEKTKEYILSNRDSEATRNLEMQARFYGIVRDVNGIKRSLRPYIKM